MRLRIAGTIPGRNIENHPVSHGLVWKLRRLALVGWDVSAWAIALYIAAILRFENVSEAGFPGVAEANAIALVTQVLVGTMVSHGYQGRYCIGTVEDAISVSRAVLLVGLIVFSANLMIQPASPRSVPLIAIPLALLLHVGARLAVRRRREHKSRPDYGCARRVIVFGAGTDGQQLVRAMLSDPEGTCLPVAILDDDPGVQSRRVCGVQVRGTSADTVRVVAATRAELLVIADRQVESEYVRRIARVATDAGLGVKVLPPLAELLRPWVVADLRDLDITDFLGRRPVEIDVSQSGNYLSNRRVLVTGAGGSIGSELCRQIHRFGPSELLMLDHDESALHGVQLSLYGHALLDSPDVILADIRDSAAIADIFATRHPDVVFHAAALKHLPMLEQYPDEAWKTNVVGTQNVLAAARLARVDRFVNISTDKAANPTSVLGLSKRVGERLVAHAALEGAGAFLSVRFGNVLGSRGSVLTTFAEQLAAGVPITVTDPEVTRFFMTIPEAVQLVVYAAAIGRPGEVLVLDMGKPVRIADVARQLMTLAGRSVEIVYTGLREGEKLHEELFGAGEVDRRPIHPLISHVDVPSANPEYMAERGAAVGAEAAMRELGVAATIPSERVGRSAADMTAGRDSVVRWQPV